MTRNEYIAAFTKHINSSLRTTLFSEDYAASMIKAFLIEHNAYAEDSSFFARALNAEINSLKQEPTSSAIIYSFERSRMLSYLVARDNLAKFGTVENHSINPNSWCRINWMNDVFYDYSSKFLVENYTHRWMYNFFHQLGYIIATGAKMHLTGDIRKVPANAHLYVYKVSSLETHTQGNPLVYKVVNPVVGTIFSRLSKNSKLAENQNTTAIKTQLCKALQTMKSVSDVVVEAGEDSCGRVVYTFKITLAPVKVPNQVQTPKEPVTPVVIDEKKWVEAINNVSNMVRPEVIALEKAYSEALEINKKATEEYTKAKKIWEESTNRLDKLEQALELLK